MITPFHRRHFLCLLVLSALGLGLLGCSKPAVSTDASGIEYYTCTMHPSVHAKAPGECPICSMDLVPILKNGPAVPAAATAPAKATEHEFTVPVARQQQIGVTFATVEKRRLQREIRAVGSVSADQTRRWNFVARVEGYVQELKVTSPGEPVAKGQPLLTIYSPELLTAEREFLNLLENPVGGKSASNGLIDSARQRLRQWDLSAAQIAKLEQERAPSEFLTLESPFQGVIESVPIEQGRKVMIGDPLATVTDLSVVWVWIALYENELPSVAAGQAVALTASAFPGRSFAGTVGLVDPFLSTSQRTGRVRIDLPNPEAQLRPGMFMNAEIAVPGGEGLAIPIDAVLPTGERALVFVDHGEGRLEPRFIKLGERFGADYAVKSGLRAGERVVSSANFLIDAEAQVQGAVKTFTEPQP